jgi:Zn-dependent peptidase ImmA (M78 family)
MIDTIWSHPPEFCVARAASAGARRAPRTEKEWCFMKNPAANLIPSKLISRYGTRDPFRICREKGIEVMFRDDFTGQKGAFSLMLNVPFIFINNNLSDEMKRIVCAHELGHAMLHRKLCRQRKNQTIYEYEIFDIRNSTEYEANIFAANLLIDEREMNEYMSYGYDIVQTARAMNLNVNLLLIKLHEMKDNEALLYTLPDLPKRNFLGTIGDNAGEL